MSYLSKEEEGVSFLWKSFGNRCAFLVNHYGCSMENQLAQIDCQFNDLGETQVDQMGWLGKGIDV